MDNYTRSARNIFSGLNLNRKPSPDDLKTPRSRAYIVVRGDEVLFEPASLEPLLLAPNMLGNCEEVDAEGLLLGADDRVSYYAINIDRLPAGTAHCISTLGTFLHLRQQVAVLPPQTAALLGYARFVAGWHTQARFCSRCGHPTRRKAASLAQVCTNPECGMEHFPRVNPAMIVLIHHHGPQGDMCLLGRQAGWKPRVYAAIAGYVEPGESAEDAVLREVMEETGLPVADIRYYCSQPWPFSGSLMLGFHARALAADIRLDDQELEEARWFPRHDIPALIESGELILPAAETIARNLFEAWYTGSLPPSP